jgi:hypothetical protein
VYLREAPSGEIVRGNADGDVLTWDAVEQQWFPMAAGPTSRTVLAFDSPQALAAADLTGVKPLTLIVLGVVNDQYLYFDAPSSPPASDGLNVIAPTTPATGRAFRQYLRNQPAQYVTNWFVDPVAGDDRNPGTALLPLQSLLEWSNRVRFAQLTAGNVTVNVAAGTLTDIAPLDLQIGSGILVTIQGAVTSTAAKTLTAVTATNALTNTRGTVSDTTAGAFARSQRLRLTSGAASGAITYCQGGTSATIAQVVGWSRYTSNVPPGNILPTQVEPAIGDSYVTDTLTTVFQGRMDLRVKGAGRLIWKDIRFTSNPASSFAAYQYWRPQSDQSSVSGVQFVACQFDANAFAGFVNASCHIDQCLFLSSATVGLNTTVGMAECVFQSTFNVFGSAYAQLQGKMTLDGGRIVQTNAGTIELNACSVQAGATAAGGVCWEVDPGCANYQHQSSRLWGPTSGYAAAIRTYSMAAFQYLTLPTLNGSTTADCIIAGVNKNWTDLPFANTSNLSEVVALP